MYTITEQKILFDPFLICFTLVVISYISHLHDRGLSPGLHTWAEIALSFLCKLGSSRKYPYPHHRRHFGIPKERGVSRTWNSEGEGGFAGLEFRRKGAFRGSGFPKVWGLLCLAF